MRKLTKEKKTVKPNLVPILDAVFIFIFFLLMSAQFIDIYEIHSDAPAIVTVNQEIDDKKPLNLILEIKRGTILVKTGLGEGTFQTIDPDSEGKYNLHKLSQILTDLKLKHIDEKSAILRPIATIPYGDIIAIMDTTRKVRGDGLIQGYNKKGEFVTTGELFDLIVFETII